MDVEKYNPIWLTLHNLSETFFEDKQAWIKKSIDEATGSTLAFIITDEHTFEAISPILFNYNHSVTLKRYMATMQRYIEIYLK